MACGASSLGQTRYILEYLSPVSHIFRFGVIGCKWGLNYIRTITQHPEWEVAQVVRASGKALPEPFERIPVSQDAGDLITGLTPCDAIIIATPTATHYPLATLCIEKRIPVLIEKPLCFSPSEAARLIELADHNRITAWVDHTHLYDQSYRTFKHHVGQSRILGINTRAGNRGPFRIDTTPSWDWLPHDIAMILDLVGLFPSEIQGELLERARLPEGIGETHRFTMRFTNGLQSTSIVSNIMDAKCRQLRVITDWGTCCLDPLQYNQVRWNDPHDEHAWYERHIDSQPPLNIILQEFTQAVRAGDRSNDSLRLGRDVVSVLNHAYPTN